MEEEDEEVFHISREIKVRFPAISSLSTSLTCTICYDPFRNPVITGCSHTFCNLCLRKFLLYRPLCPQCGLETHDSQLRLNKAAQDATLAFKSLVKSLQTETSPAKLSTAATARTPRHKSSEPVTASNTLAVKTEKAEIPDTDSDADMFDLQSNTATDCSGSISSHAAAAFALSSCEAGTSADADKSAVAGNSSGGAPAAIHSPSPADGPSTGDDNLAAGCSTVAAGSSSVAAGSSSVAAGSSSVAAGSSLVTGGGGSGSTSSGGKTECLLCHVSVPRHNYNRHLNTCLDKKTAAAPSEKPPPANRKPLPKLVYTLIKESDLRKRCKEVGLNTRGDKRVLIARHQRFTLLYNSQCFLGKGRPYSQVSRQVEREELLEKKSSAGGQSSLLKFDRNTDKAAIEAKQKQYLKENKDSFQQLIASAKITEKKVPDTDIHNKENLSEEDDVILVIDPDFPLPAPSPQPGPRHVTSKRGAENLPVSLHKSPAKIMRHQLTNAPAPFQPLLNTRSDESQPAKDALGNNPENPAKAEPIKGRISVKQEPTAGQGKTAGKKPTGKSASGGKLSLARNRAGSAVRSPAPAKLSNTQQKNIRDSLAKSVERAKAVSRICCPVCQAAVVEKYLNIHLDKCLRKNEPDPSPIFSRKSKPKRGGRLTARRNKIFSSDEDDSDFENDTTPSITIEDVSTDDSTDDEHVNDDDEEDTDASFEPWETGVFMRSANVSADQTVAGGGTEEEPTSPCSSPNLLRASEADDPILEQYTEMISQGSYRQDSDQDMFEPEIDIEEREAGSSRLSQPVAVGSSDSLCIEDTSLDNHIHLATERLFFNCSEDTLAASKVAASYTTLAASKDAASYTTLAASKVAALTKASNANKTATSSSETSRAVKNSAVAKAPTASSSSTAVKEAPTIVASRRKAAQSVEREGVDPGSKAALPPTRKRPKRGQATTEEEAKAAVVETRVTRRRRLV